MSLGQARLAACEAVFACCRGELYPCETGVRLCEELETGAPRRPTQPAAQRCARHEAWAAAASAAGAARSRPRGMPVLARVWLVQLQVGPKPYPIRERARPGREVEVDMDRDVLTDLASGKEYPLKPLGEARCPNSNPIAGALVHACWPGRGGCVVRLTVDLP
jgi:hypothetical protein